MQYNNTPTVCVALVPVGGGLLMIRRNLPDGKGKLALPGGFQVRPDTVQEAAAREVKEETGLIIPPENFQTLHIETVPDRSVNLLFFLANKQPHQDTFTHDEEVQEVVIITEACETAFPLHTQWVKTYFDMIR